MKKLFTSSLLLFFFAGNAQLYKGKESSVSFFSKSPLEDIEAINKSSVVSVFKSTTGDFQSEVVIKGFVFDKPLMQEHFNENYLESDKFPSAKLVAKISETIDVAKDGESDVTAKGKLTIHGVTKEVEIKGKMIIKGGLITVQTKFPIKISDYNIKVPTLYVKNIAEVVDVTFISTLEPFAKK
jgi:hypothetical protein